MILPDANLLLYAYNSLSPEHDRASVWWEDAVSSNESIGLCWQTLTAFLRIGTNPRVFPKPLSADEAIKIVSLWLEQPNTKLVTPGSRHWSILSKLATAGQALGPLMMDAHLAALAIEHGATLVTNDRDFARFPGVRVVNPLL